MDEANENVIDLLECPYNAAHKLLAHTMARHISRCRRAHGILKLVQCPFNLEHHVPEPEMTLHKLECEDREAFEPYKFCFTTLIDTPKAPRRSSCRGSPASPVVSRRSLKSDTGLDGLGSPTCTPRSTRRRTLCGPSSVVVAAATKTAPTPVVEPSLDHSWSRVYDLRTACRSGRRDSPTHSSCSPTVDRKLPPPVAAVVPSQKAAAAATVKPVGSIALLVPAKLEKENAIVKGPAGLGREKFRTPVKISQRKLSIDDFRKHWKQVHNERRAQLRSRDRSARRSCYT